MKKFCFIALIAVANILPAYAQGDAAAGKLKAPSCVFCHNPNGPNSNKNYPSLNGQSETYLFNAMRAYQLNQRQGALAEMMTAQLQHLNEQDLKDVAAFYSQAQGAD
ncbi:c-type cytochrome [Vibrio paucivorans]|uniref:C-type cytochrome n=1 Tax=Vibrio paucivorans TaxID=2829489 RepID=A0A9X3CGL5_9VIBR|nr:c-type cytochrome [Vibrio paucivorans]MCW8335507.1 c-type cytochrome [Vibrio paucivorans]